jgi:hypothetical protein
MGHVKPKQLPNGLLIYFFLFGPKHNQQPTRPKHKRTLNIIFVSFVPYRDQAPKDLISLKLDM